MEIDALQNSHSKKRKRAGKEEADRLGKKRKRKDTDTYDNTSSSKKHRSKGRSQSPSLHEGHISRLDSPPISPFYQQTSSLYVSVPPISQRHMLEGICAEHLSPLLLTYYPPFHGIIICYTNARLAAQPTAQAIGPAYARAVDEYAANFIWLTADFLLFKPQKDDVIEGWVNLQNESNIGLVCWNFFNASIEKKRLAHGWKWIFNGLKPTGRRKLQNGGDSVTVDFDEDALEHYRTEEQLVDDAQGYFRNSNGDKIGGLFRFSVKCVETTRGVDRENGFLSIEGTMLSDDEEKELQEQEAAKAPKNVRRQKERIGESRNVMSGALLNGFDDVTDVDHVGYSTNEKHRLR